MTPIKIALIPRTASGRCSLAEASSVAAAIQSHVINFAQIWQASAVVGALETLELGYVPLYIVDGPLPAQLTGYHTVQRDGSYYAVVEYGPTWSLAASHECLEMILDPHADRRLHGFSPEQNPNPVDFIVEVCDPCQDLAFSHPIGNWRVSDFVLPRYFDDHVMSGQVYSYFGNLQGPKQVLPGGSLAWIDVRNDVWQMLNSNGKINIINRGQFAPGRMAAHEYVHQFGPGYGFLSRGSKRKKFVLTERARRESLALAHSIRAQTYESHFDSLIEKHASAPIGEQSMARHQPPKGAKK